MYDNDPVQIARIVELGANIKEFAIDDVKRIKKVRKHTDASKLFAEKTLPAQGRDHRAIS